MEDLIDSLIQEINNLKDRAHDYILEEVETLARNVLSRNPKEVNEFIMCMGSFFFADKKNEVLWNHVSKELKGYRELEEWVNKFDDRFKITGNAMRFTANSPVVTDW